MSPNEDRKRSPSVRPAHEHPPCPVMESTTTVTADRECTIKNQQAPKQNQQNPPVKIKSGKANQEKSQEHQQTQKQSNASETKTETKQANTVNGNQEQQQQKQSTKQEQQQQSKLEQIQNGLVKEIKGNNIDCSVSAVLKRSDELRYKVIKVNKLLKTVLVELDVQLIEHNNINEYHLNKSGLHLNGRGDAALARNLIQFIKNLKA